MFVLNLKRILPEIKNTVIAYVTDVYNQYSEWVRVAEKISKVSRERQLKIDNLNLTAAQDNRISAHLNAEFETLRKS